MKSNWNSSAHIIMISRKHQLKPSLLAAPPTSSTPPSTDNKIITIHFMNHSVSITEIGHSNPSHPSLTDTYITDGTRTALVTAAPLGIPIANAIGAVQCPSAIHAVNLTVCTIPQDACSCDVHQSNVTCECDEVDIERYFNLHSEKTSSHSSTRTFH